MSSDTNTPWTMRDCRGAIVTGNIADIEHIIACVNACDGIDNPGALAGVLRTAARITHERIPCGEDSTGQPMVKMRRALVRQLRAFLDALGGSE